MVLRCGQVFDGVGGFPALASAPMDATQITYVCFKTNAGKYGFLIPREVQAGGVDFDAYLFP